MAVEKIKVFVIDDSAFMRRIIRDMLETDSEIEVIGTAMSGKLALLKLERLKPDVITLDVEMPDMDGIEVLQKILSKYSIPILMFSSYTDNGTEVTLRALEYGAVDFIKKPDGILKERSSKFIKEFIDKVKTVRGIKPQVNISEISGKVNFIKKQVTKKSISKSSICKNIVAIGISTGGPSSLAKFLPQIPANIDASILIVQHIPEEFTKTLAKRLDEKSMIEVKEAENGDLLKNGRALLAKGNHHLGLEKKKYGVSVILDNETPPDRGHRPSADYMFKAVAKLYGKNSIGIVMTGMGFDGTDGMRELKKSGAITLAQDEKSSVIFGMPKSVIKEGLVDTIVPLDKMAEFIVNSVNKLNNR